MEAAGEVDTAAITEADFDETRVQAEQGQADAQNHLGVMYFDGVSVARDHANAAKWYRKATEQGHSDVQYNLGVMYQSGRGVPQDLLEAVNWFNKAAE
jgi:TPR repeat protein